MTDFYQMLFGQPAPGKRASPPVLDYLRDPDASPQIEGRGRNIVPEMQNGDQIAASSREAARRRLGARGVTMGEDATLPFGDDFAYWVASNEPPRNEPPAYLRASEQEEAVREMWGENTATAAQATQAPRPIDGQPSRGRGPADIERPRGQRGGRRATSRSEEELQAGINETWREAEARALERWRRGAPSAADRFLAAVGVISPRRMALMEEETAAMRREAVDGR